VIHDPNALFTLIQQRPGSSTTPLARVVAALIGC